MYVYLSGIHTWLDVCLAPESSGPDYFVNTKAMLDSFSKDIIFRRLPPPYTPPIHLELVRFQPGQPEVLSPSSVPRPPSRQHYALPHPSPMPPYAVPVPMHLAPSTSTLTTVTSASLGQPHPPPPPPWSRWAPMTTPSRPPSTQRRQIQIPEAPCPPPLPPPPRKRKHTESSPPSEDQSRTTSVGPEPAPKRRIVQGPSPTASQSPASQAPTPTLQPMPPRPGPTLSPSLALIVSPTNEPIDLRSSPTTSYPIRNGTNGSPRTPGAP